MPTIFIQITMKTTKLRKLKNVLENLKKKDKIKLKRVLTPSYTCPIRKKLEKTQ